MTRRRTFIRLAMAAGLIAMLPIPESVRKLTDTGQISKSRWKRMPYATCDSVVVGRLWFREYSYTKHGFTVKVPVCMTDGDIANNKDTASLQSLLKALDANASESCLVLWHEKQRKDGRVSHSVHTMAADRVMQSRPWSRS